MIRPSPSNKRLNQTVPPVRFVRTSRDMCEVQAGDATGGLTSIA